MNHAFASAIAPCDEFEDQRVREAIRLLELDPDAELTCAYCGNSAETWDHIFATVRKSQFSGYGHRLGNLLPCCKPCNSRKGNKSWEVYLETLPLPEAARERRSECIRRFLAKYSVLDPINPNDPDLGELEGLRTEILRLMARADTIATRIRSRQAAP
ncbi:MAG: hypothetical protein J0L64_06790 [Acidobacteria bacterium]|nr:hypothetical protein [Acidobacteriota bacterium]